MNRRIFSGLSRWCRFYVSQLLIVCHVVVLFGFQPEEYAPFSFYSISTPSHFINEKIAETNPLLHHIIHVLSFLFLHFNRCKYSR